MELGITPIITSGMVFQLLAGTHLIDVNLDMKSDRELYQTAQKRKNTRKKHTVSMSLSCLSPCHHPLFRSSLCLRCFWHVRYSQRPWCGYLCPLGRPVGCCWRWYVTEK